MNYIELKKLANELNFKANKDRLYKITKNILDKAQNQNDLSFEDLVTLYNIDNIETNFTLFSELTKCIFENIFEKLQIKIEENWPMGFNSISSCFVNKEYWIKICNTPFIICLPNLDEILEKSDIQFNINVKENNAQTIDQIFIEINNKSTEILECWLSFIELGLYIDNTSNINTFEVTDKLEIQINWSDIMSIINNTFDYKGYRIQKDTNIFDKVTKENFINELQRFNNIIY